MDKVTAPMLNTGVDRLEDILVLHLAGGKDLFVSFLKTQEISQFVCMFIHLSTKLAIKGSGKFYIRFQVLTMHDILLLYDTILHLFSNYIK